MIANTKQLSKLAQKWQLLKTAVMRCFISNDKYIKKYLNNNGGSKKLSDGTWIVNQSDEFHKWCYNEGYKLWKSK